jgi:hypothetical protein
MTPSDRERDKILNTCKSLLQKLDCMKISAEDGSTSPEDMKFVRIGLEAVQKRLQPQ